MDRTAWSEPRSFERPRLETRHTHGTGCTLASAVAVGLVQGMALRDAVGRARDYVQAAIATAPGYGAGRGPLDHAVTWDVSRITSPGRLKNRADSRTGVIEPKSAGAGQ